MTDEATRLLAEDMAALGSFSTPSQTGLMLKWFDRLTPDRKKSLIRALRGYEKQWARR